MSKSTALAESMAGLMSLPTTQVVDLSEYEGGGNFLQRIQLYSKGKALKHISAGHFGIPNDDGIEDLGEAIDILVLSVRNKALDTSGEKTIVCYDKTDPVYQDIKSRAGTEGSGCMEGPSFLFQLRDGKRYEFFCINTSAQKAAKDIAKYLPIRADVAKANGIDPRGPVPCTLKARECEKGDWFWHAPEPGKCSTPFKDVDWAEVAEEIQKFENPPKQSVEIASSKEEDR